MAIYDGFFDAVLDEASGEYDRAYDSGDFTGYFGQITGSGVCIYGNPDSLKVRSGGENSAIVGPGYLFIQGYWLKNDADYTVPISGTGAIAIAAHLNLGQRTVEILTVPKANPEIYPDMLVLAYADTAAGTVEDTRYRTDICGVIDAVGSLSGKVEYALNYIDTQIDTKLAQTEAAILEQSALLDAQITQMQAQVDAIVPPPIGSIKFSASQNVGAEWLHCDGSFISETDYPELVAVLGKLTPGVEDFYEAYQGAVGSGLTNGVLYNGTLWTYSVTDRKLYGYSEASKQLKSISVTGAEKLTPGISLENIVCLSIAGGYIFLARSSHTKSEFLLYESAFTGSESSLSLTTLDVRSKVNQSLTLWVSTAYSIPEVCETSYDGGSLILCVCVIHRNTTTDAIQFLVWKPGAFSDAVALLKDTDSFTSGNHLNATNLIYRSSKKNRGELLTFDISGSSSSSLGGYRLVSYPNGIYDSLRYTGNVPIGNAESDPLKTFPVAGNGYFIYRCFIDDQHLILRAGKYNPILPPGFEKDGRITAVPVLPRMASVFFDSICYAESQDLWMVFVGTGIAFAKNPLDANSWGYLDTQETLGVITRCGCLEFDEENQLLYISGQDTTNHGKLGILKFPDLYDYANDGAWLPSIASDGVPAYIKAKEPEAAS